MPQLETKKGLIVVRTYPVPAQRGIEVSCTAAITEQKEWLRLFPIPYRFLSDDQKFEKYQWIKCLVTTPRDDKRPESFRLQENSIEVLSNTLSTANFWQARKEYIFPMMNHCLCCLKRERDRKGYPTLGIFRPKTIKRLIIEPDSPTWTEDQLQKLQQAGQSDFFRVSPKKQLEKVPFKFFYEFTCDDGACIGHTLSCTDWEMGQSWRKWTAEYGSEWKEKFRQTFETAMIEKNDTHFYVGTVHRYPENWIIVGLFYPPKTTQRELFNGSTAP